MRRSQCSGLAPSLTWCSTAGCAMVDRSGALQVLRVTVRHFWRISALPTLVLDGLVKWMPAWSHLQFLYKLKFLQILKDHERSKRATGCARAASVCPSALLHHHHRIPEGCPKGKHSIWVADSQGCLLKAFLWELHSAGKQRRSCDPKSCFRPACCGLSFSWDSWDLVNRQASHAASHKQTSPRVLEFQLGTLRIEDRLGVRFRATSTKEKGKLADRFEDNLSCSRLIVCCCFCIARYYDTLYVCNY